MSHVSGVTLQVSCGETSARASREHLSGRLSLLTDHYGGTKHPQTIVIGGGMNYFDEDEFAAFVMSRPWLSTRRTWCWSSSRRKGRRECGSAPASSS